MPTYTSLKQYRAALGRRMKRLKKSAKRSEKDAAAWQVAKAKQLAPVDTRATIRGIRRRNTSRGWTVESWVSGKFKQNMWANRTSPFAAPRMRWNQGKPTVYGDRTHNITGTPGFFDVAAKMTRKKFRDVTLKHTRKSLRSA